MGKLYNKLAKAKYLNNYDPVYLLETYKRLSALYDNKEIPFVNVGLLEETQIKTYYDNETKVFSIIFECSRPNRVQKKFPFSIDWIINLFALPTSMLYQPYSQDKTKNFTKYHRTHAGFSLAFIKIIDYIEARIQDVYNNNQEIKKFEVFGWSYGGAMATMCHGWLANKYHIMNDANNDYFITTITIGAPRTYFKIPFNILKASRWKELKNNYQNIYLFSNAYDIVTKVPFKFMSYSHIMPRIILEKHANIFRIFRPNIYHHKTNYDKIIINKLTKEVLKLKGSEPDTVDTLVI